MRPPSLLALPVIVALCSATALASDKLDQSKAILSSHCVSCHGNEKTKGNLNLG